MGKVKNRTDQCPAIPGTDPGKLREFNSFGPFVQQRCKFQVINTTVYCLNFTERFEGLEFVSKCIFIVVEDELELRGLTRQDVSGPS